MVFRRKINLINFFTFCKKLLVLVGWVLYCSADFKVAWPVNCQPGGDLIHDS
jgi:hypothetical protein